MLGIIIAAFLMSDAVSSPSADNSDVTAATSWMDLLDEKRFDDSWNEAGNIFKSRLPQARWASTIQPVRDPLGAVSLRLLKSIRKAMTLPGAPDGDYEVVQFQTSFAHKSNAIETVVLAREQSRWKVDGYFIR